MQVVSAIVPKHDLLSFLIKTIFIGIHALNADENEVSNCSSFSSVSSSYAIGF